MNLGSLMQGKPRTDTPGVTIATPRSYELFVDVCFAGRMTSPLHPARRTQRSPSG